MLLIVCGCGPAAQFGAALLATLCRARFGAAAIVEAGTAEAMRAALGVLAPGVTILRLAAPERRIVDALLRSRRPVLLFDDGFRDAVPFVMDRHAAPFVAALRHVVQGVATIADLALSPDTQRVPSSNAGAFGALCRFAGIDPAGLDLDAIAGDVAEAAAANARRRRLSDDERGTLDALAPGYDAAARGETPVPIVWPPGLCLQADCPDVPVCGPLDLTGRARLLTYGPYLHLPAGEWSLRAGFEADDNRSGNRVEVAVLSGGARLGAAALRLPVAGPARLDVPFVVAEPRSAIEVYCATLEGAIEGRLRLAAFELRQTTLSPSGP